MMPRPTLLRLRGPIPTAATRAIRRWRQRITSSPNIPSGERRLGRFFSGSCSNAGGALRRRRLRGSFSRVGGGFGLRGRQRNRCLRRQQEEGKSLLKVKPDRLIIVAQVADRHILADI